MTIIKPTTIDFELARFFVALNKTLEILHLPSNLKLKISEDLQRYYLNTTDEEVRNWAEKHSLPVQL